MTINDRPEGARRWDAGDAACGEFVVRLKRELALVPPGGVLELTTRNTGAHADLPAWCRMTGHALVCMNHPIYVIEKSGC